MNEKTNKLIQEQFQKLPATLQKAIMSNDFREKLRSISSKYKLHLDKGVIFENETLMVMMGLDDTSSFTKNLQDGLEIERETAEEITADVAKDILLPIRESLRELLNNQEKEEANRVTNSPTEKEVLEAPETIVKAKPEDTKTDLSAQKLNETTQISTKKVNVTEKNKEKKPFSDDPYRETIE